MPGIGAAMGAVLGRLVSASGGATALGKILVDNCGPKGLPWALMALGILVGMPVFFEVGLVLLLPIVAAAALRSGRPPMLKPFICAMAFCASESAMSTKAKPRGRPDPERRDPGGCTRPG